LVHLHPTRHDTDDYVAAECENGDGSRDADVRGESFGNYSRNGFCPRKRGGGAGGFQTAGGKTRPSVEEAAKRVLDVSCRKVQKQIDELIAEYNLDRATVELVGGGGGAASLVPYSGKLMNLPARLARKAEVISTIGVALAMVRDVVERNIDNPSPEQILQVRREASDAVIKIGALPESVEVQIEVDTRRNLVRAVAFGTTELKKDENKTTVGGFRGCLHAAARSMKTEASAVKLAGETAGLYAFARTFRRKTFFGLFKNARQIVRVVDKNRRRPPSAKQCRSSRFDGRAIARNLESVIRN
jgi:hypothetical protein